MAMLLVVLLLVPSIPSSAEKKADGETPVEADPALDPSLDLSSMELLVGTEDPSIFTEDTEVVSEYDGVYLTRYGSVEETRKAYMYYSAKADFVDPNISFRVSEEEAGADLLDLNQGNDAISRLNDLDTDHAAPGKTVALIDTGVNAATDVERVSLIGDFAADDNGHGTRMYEDILREYPEARVMSVKAVNSSGRGKASDIYAAIEYAVLRRADVINLSVCAYSTAENAAIRSAVEKAVEQGITVVGAAGNHGRNVKYYVPGNIGEAVIVGACDENGVRRGSSNYGATVDGYLVADSTSEAAAIASARILRDGVDAAKESFLSGEGIRETEGTEENGYENGAGQEEGDTSQETASSSDGENEVEGADRESADQSGESSDPGTSDEDGDSKTNGETGDPRTSDESGDPQTAGEEPGDVDRDTDGKKELPDREYIETTEDTALRKEAERNNEATKEAARTLATTDKVLLVKCMYVSAKDARNVSDAWRNHAEEVLDYTTEYVPLLDDGSGYYKACVQNLMGNMEVLDHSFALTNTYGVIYGGGTFDDQTKEISIPKKVYEGRPDQVSKADGSPVTEMEMSDCDPKSPVAVEFLLYTGRKKYTPVFVRLKSETEEIRPVKKSFTVQELVADTLVKIPLTEECLNGLPLASLSVYINGSENAFPYERMFLGEDGILSLQAAPISVHTVEIVIRPGNFETAVPVLVGGTKSGEAVAELSINPVTLKVGDYFESDLFYIDERSDKNNNQRYDDLATSSAAYCNSGTLESDYWNFMVGLTGRATAADVGAADNADRYNNITWKNSAGKEKEEPFSFRTDIESWNNWLPYDRAAAERNTPTIGAGQSYMKKAGALFLVCAEHTVTAGGSYHYKATVTAKGEDYFILDFVSNTTHSQVARGKYRFSFPAGNDYTSLWKKQTDGDRTISPTKSMEGIRYTLRDTKGTDIAVFTLDKAGLASAVKIVKKGYTSVELKYGTKTQYAVKAPDGVSMLGYVYEETGTNNNYKGGDQVEAVIRHLEETPTKLSEFGGLTAVSEGSDEVRHYFTTIRKTGTGVRGLSFKGTVYGLYDSNTRFTNDHLVAFFIMDENGNTAEIRKGKKGDFSCDAFSKYCSGRWDYVVVSGQIEQHVLCMREYDGVDAPKDFYYKELTAPAGYEKNEAPIQAIVVPKDSAGSEELELEMSAKGTSGQFGKNEMTRDYDRATVYVALKKSSTDPSVTEGNPNYNLTGAEYKLYKKKADADAALTERNAGTANAFRNAIGTFTVKANGTTDRIDVSSHMDIEADGKDYASTRFYVVESKAPEHFQISDTVSSVLVTKENVGTANHPAAEFRVSDTPARGRVRVRLLKKGKKRGENGLAGARFTVRFYPADVTKGYTYEQLQGMTEDTSRRAIFTTGEMIDGKLRSEIDALYPVGYVTIEETKAPDGYVLPADGDKAEVDSGGKKVEVPVRPAMVLSSVKEAKGGYRADEPYVLDASGKKAAKLTGTLTEYNEFIFRDDEIRGNIELTKLDLETGKPIQGVRFRLDRLEDTGDILETHYLFTDETGYLTTVTTEYGEDVNFYDDTEEYDPERKQATVWFGRSGEENVAPVNGEAALPAGTYVLTEMPCAASKEYQLAEPVTFSVTEQNELIRLSTDPDGNFYNVPKPAFRSDAAVAVGAEGEDGKMLPAGPGQTIIDTCICSNLKADTEYTMVGRVMQRQGSGKAVPFLQDGKEVVASTTFTTSAKPSKHQTKNCVSDTVQVEFTDLDFSGYPDQEFVIYETLYLGSVKDGATVKGNYADANPEATDLFPIVHEDPDNRDQMVRTPGGRTRAKDITGGKTISHTDKITLYDTITYTGLKVGEKYTATGTLYQRPEGAKDTASYTAEELSKMILRLPDGQPVTGSVTFTAETEDGSVRVPFTFDTSLLTGKEETIVVFEDVSHKGVSVFTHADLNDRDQTLYHPEISTTASDVNGRSELAETAEKFYDEIRYSNLEPETEYRVFGVAMDKKTGDVLKLNGKELKAESLFRTGSSNRENGAVDGSFRLEFTVTEAMQKELSGRDMVLFETVYTRDEETEAWRVVAEHSDLEDKGQELRVPSIHTMLSDTETETHVARPREKVTLVDVVKYTGLIPGEVYIMEGSLVKKPGKKGDKEQKLKDAHGKEVTAEVEFTASETGDGEVGLTFTFDANLLELPGTSVVAFEVCRHREDRLPVAVHADINDMGQTVDFPKVGTKASRNRTGEKLTVTDIVEYRNLTAGYSYTVKGMLVKADGTPLEVNGKKILAETTFKPEKPDGTVTVTFPAFDPYFAYEGRTDVIREYKYVVFEEVYVNTIDQKGNEVRRLVGVHKDLKDRNQTVTDNEAPQTGDMTPLAALSGLCLLAGIGIGVLLWKKRKLKKEEI